MRYLIFLFLLSVRVCWALNEKVELSLDVKDKAVSGQRLFYSVYDLQAKKYVEKNKIIGSDNKIIFPVITDYDFDGSCKYGKSSSQSYKFIIQIMGARFNQYNLSLPVELSIDNVLCDTSVYDPRTASYLSYGGVISSHIKMTRHPALKGAVIDNLRVTPHEDFDRHSSLIPVTLTYELKIPFAYSLGSSYIRTKLNPDVYDVVQNDFKF
jgi:hypothetical protein